ncbi:SphA family protein [Aquabacterium sp.]|uniref:SphA family protein n=1 Tax=Aquabacterium sp. TaxID=1872578 RepID=UPI002D000550|nr:transporter [Aquabacterium sp.]HSW06055.1 transporter [Aquabacterium sp.]
MSKLRMPAAAAAMALVSLVPAAQAGEGGGSSYPGGVENFLTGAAPPPGFYVLAYGNVFRADKLKDDSGHDVPLPVFKIAANVVSTRFVYSTPTTLAGGNLMLHAIVPLVDLKVDVPGLSQRKTGLADITFGPGLAFHHSPNLHSVVGFDFVAPIGRYAKGDLTNIGRNYWSLQPLYTVSYLDAAGFNADAKLTFNFSRRNKDTDYRSGNEVYLDYSAGWGLGNGWVLGAGGYAMRQLTSDTQAGVSLANSKGAAFAIGPSLKYDNGKGWFITAKWQREMSVRNRPEGNALWIKTILPF